MNKKDCVNIVCGIAVLAVVGCADENERIADYAMESARWQAEQSQTLADANQQLADGSRGLVTADAASRQELAILQRELRADQAEIAQQYATLAANQQQWTEQREFNANAGSSLLGIVLLLACLTPFVLAAMALFGQNDPPSEEEIDAVSHLD
jgi:hypothetical protein